MGPTLFKFYYYLGAPHLVFAVEDLRFPVHRPWIFGENVGDLNEGLYYLRFLTFVVKTDNFRLRAAYLSLDRLVKARCRAPE